MTNANSLYETPTREIYLLENVPIQGRKTELRQLLKLLNLAKTGQPKAALITGDAGIGKTALLDTFMNLVYEGVYCRVLNLGKMDFASPEAVYVSFIEKLQDDANRILDDALVAVNEITGELDLRWERQDLARAIALVKLQESIGGKDAISQEQLVKAIRSQVPAVKKLKFSVNESIEKLVDLIVNPWVMVATSILNPMTPALQEAVHLAETLRANGFAMPAPQEASAFKPEARPVQESATPAREPLPPLDVATATPDEVEGIVSSPKPVKKLGTIVDTELGALPEESGDRRVSDRRVEDRGFQAPTVSASQHAVTHVEGMATPMAKPIKDPLIKHLMHVFNFINATINKIDSGMLVVVDEWDRIQDKPRQTELKEFFTELIYQVTEQKNYHFMVVMAARTEGESYTLGGALYNHFRTKLLLDALNDSACHKLIRKPMKDVGVELEEDVYQRIARLSRGNPYWHLKILSYMSERIESNRLKHVNTDFFEKLGIDKISNLLELSFTRLKLTFLNDEESLDKVIASLIKQFGEAPFSANQAIKEISASQGFTDGYVFEVLRALFKHDFISQVEANPRERRATDGRALEDRSRQADPQYVIQSRTVLEFLEEKTRSIETDISTDEKLMYLKKVIPLSVKSGDLDRQKTMEVLALGDAMGNPEIVEFLEDIFLEYLRDDKPVVRVTALNNIALIDSSKSRDALFRAMKDEDSMVREYAARNLATLSQKNHDPALANRIIDVLIQSIDDESEAVRTQIYTTISKYRWNRDLTSVFVKGMSDACDGVRLTSIKNLADEGESPYVFSSLLDAAQDRMPEIRRYACLGLQRYPSPEAIDIIVKILQTDQDSGIRALAADSLSRMDDKKAFMALVNAIRKEPTEDVKLAVARALGKRRGWETEAILLEALQNADWDNMPVFVWACVRSLGQTGGTERARDLLLDLKRKISNPIILSAIEMSVRRISERLQELRQMERQLEEATPLTVAIPSEYDEEVMLPEEEVLQEELSAEELAEEANEAQQDAHVEETAAESDETAEEPEEYKLSGPLRAIFSKSGQEATAGGRTRSGSILKLPFEK